MKIELTDDNGMINGGVPTLVVLVIDGKLRIPYEATKTIQQVYEDVQKLNIKEQPVLEQDVPVHDFTPTPVRTSNEIEREDIVKCIKKYERDPGSDDDLVVGNLYRVLDIKKKNGTVVQYDVLDDNSDMRIRIAVFPDEIVLEKKRTMQPPRVTIPDIIKKCEHCKTENALIKVSNLRYEGLCEQCGAKLVEVLDNV